MTIPTEGRTCACSSLTRRSALAAGGLAVAAVAAACGSDSPATTPSTSTSGASSGSAGGEIAKVADIPDGGSLVVGQVLLARSGDTVVAHSVVCTHQGCPVQAAGAEAHCNCHGSKFNATTGAVLQGPATKPLSEVAVTVSNGAVLQS